MPFLDGFAATSEIRSLEAGSAAAACGCDAASCALPGAATCAPPPAPAAPPPRRVPVVAVTTLCGSDVLCARERTGGSGLGGGTVDALSAANGLDGLVTKPVAFSVLQQLLGGLIRAEDAAAARLAAAAAAALRARVLPQLPQLRCA